LGGSEQVLGGPWVRLGVPGGGPGASWGAKGRPQGVQKRSGGASGTLFDALKNIEKPLVFVMFWCSGHPWRARGPPLGALRDDLGVP